MVFPFTYENDKLKLGMYKKNSHEVVEIDKCLLTSENINKILRISRDYFYKNVKNFVKNNNDTKIEFDVQGISIDNLDNISRKTLN